MQSSISIPLFFVLSGFVTAYTTKLDIAWVAKRVFQVMIPFVVYGITSQIIWSPDAVPYYTNLFLTGGLANGLWFFVTIAWCFVLISVIGLFRFKGFLIMLLAALGLIASVALISYALLSVTGIYNFLGGGCVVSYFPFFFIGYLLSIYKDRVSFINKIYFTVPSLFIFPVFMLYCFYSNILTESLTKYWMFFDFNIAIQLMIRVLQILFGLVFAYTVAQLLIKLSVIKQILSWIGKNTIPIYAVQGFFILWIITKGIPILLMFVIVLILCSLWVWLVNRTRVTKVLFAGSWSSMMSLWFELRRLTV